MKRKKVLVILGSPRRRGNSAALASRVAAGARASGADVETFFLHAMDIRPCTACDACRGDIERDCIMDDDMRLLYPRLRRAHAWVIASPIYWFTVSAQTKLFMDRWYALGGPGGYHLKGKRMGIVLTYEDVDPFLSGAVNALRTLQDAFRHVHAHYVGAVYGSAAKPGEIRTNRALMRDAFRLGRALVET